MQKIAVSVFCNIRLRSSVSAPTVIHNPLETAAIIDELSCQHSVVQFTVKKKNSAANIAVSMEISLGFQQFATFPN